MVRGLSSSAKITNYPDVASGLLVSYLIVNVITVSIDALVACYIATQLRERLLSAAMADDMKRKSVIQMTLLMVILTASLVLQIVMDVPVLISGVVNSWSSLSYESFCILRYLVPGVFLSLAFLYIMRRVEQREPTRLVVLPSTQLVEFVECSSPDCVWCAHHRRYHVNQNKWDATFMTSLSPRTVDSSYHSSTHANLSQGSWSSASTPELQATHSHMARDSHYRLHQVHVPVPPAFPTQSQGNHPGRRPGRLEARFS
ncbi:hypothetical protein BBJ28_00020863 [Nothophytophthora sp. Chile5]|nr:hypothetical protein BBJ28_00020863 [Nothophytophthora sp. Chile5]